MWPKAAVAVCAVRTVECSNVSATPSDYELEKTEGIYTEQIIRPTGLLDPIIEVRESKNQIDDLINEIQIRVEKDERILVTTLTKRMAEELTKCAAPRRRDGSRGAESRAR